MLKEVVLFGLILCLLPTVWSAEYASVNVRTTFTEPYPVEPGKNLELSIEISNTGTKELNKVIVELKPNYPFTLLEGSKKEINILQIDSSKIIEYDLFVDDSAISTMYNIPVEITYDTSKLTKEVQINVQGKPDFKLLGMSTDLISSGDQAKISVRISNVGTGKAKRTTATFTSGSTYIKPIFSGGNVYIGDFEPRETKDIEFLILASSDAEYGVYTGTIALNYQDESGNISTKNFDVGILVSGEPKFQVIKTELEMETRELSVELVNIGTAEAKGITANFVINGKVFDVDYVTSVKIDKRTTLKFTLPNNRMGELLLSYEGPDNRKFNQTEVLTWNVPFTTPAWIWVVVIVIVGYIVWKKRLWKKL